MKKGLAALQRALKRNGEAGYIRPADTNDLAKAETAGFPRELLDFYREYEPDGYIEIEQRLWSIRSALIENFGGVPGIGLYPRGYVIFASTTGGDAYCVDTNVTNEQGEHPIVLFGHETINEKTELSYIQQARVEVAFSLDDFLYRFASGALSEDVRYPPRSRPPAAP